MTEDPLAVFLSKAVVVDTDADIVYIGVLDALSPGELVLSEADVHSIRDAGSTREIYVMESAKYGVRSNRRRVHLMRSRVVSVSLMEDVLRY
jgi:hypothetical protein